MIIRLTVRDNDFSNIIGLFIQNLRVRITDLPTNIREKDIDEQMEMFEEAQFISRLLNPNITKKHTEEEKEILIKKIKNVFNETVRKNFINDKDTADYLIEKFDVQIIDCMEDKWENGEVWYWFQHSGICLNQ